MLKQTRSLEGLNKDLASLCRSLSDNGKGKRVEKERNCCVSTEFDKCLRRHIHENGNKLNFFFIEIQFFLWGIVRTRAYIFRAHRI